VGPDIAEAAGGTALRRIGAPRRLPVPGGLERRRQPVLGVLDLHDVADDMDAGLEKRLGRGVMQMIGRDDGDDIDPVGPRCLARRHLGEAAIGAVGGDAETRREAAAAFRIRGQRARHQLVAVVEPRRHAMHRADEGIGAAADHAEAQAALLRHDGSAQAEKAAVDALIDAGAGEIVEGAIGRLDDVPGNEGRAFGRPLLAALDAAFPFQHRPAGKIILREPSNAGS
jgi:hypothetical protein